MSPTLAALHLANFLLPGLLLGLLSAAAAKLVWGRALAGRSWLGMAAWGGTAALLAQVGALLLTGRDGSMAGHAASVLACALGLYLGGFAGRRG